MSPQTIVVLDDEPVALGELARMLAQAGHEVRRACGTVAEACAALAATPPPDLLVADLFIERAPTGLEACREASRLGIPYFLVTGYPAAEALRHVVGARPLGLLYKPPDYKDLVTRIELAFKRRAGPAEQAEPATVSFRVGGRTVVLAADDVVYVESHGNHCVVTVADGRALRVAQTLSGLAAEVFGEGFSRVHRSFVVNLARVVAYGYDHAVVGEEVRVPVGRTYRRAFAEEMRRRLRTP